MAEQLLTGPVRESAREPARRRLPAGAVFGASFAVLLTLLLVRDTGVFTMHVAERGDSAANSIIVAQAKHFRLLVGNYSRIGFSHPGPAFFYVFALGEWLGYDVLGALPSPYNGQWLAALALNAALVAAALTILWTWSRSWRAWLWAAAAALAFLGTHDNVLTSTWMPFVYVAPFLLFLTAAASVAAGRTAHLWLLALAGGLLVHGHAEFLLLFVPATALAVLAALRYGRPRPPFVARHWPAAGAVVALFLLPMVLNLVLHWPGEYGKYLGYGGHHASSHGLGADLRYFGWFWLPQPLLGVLLAVAGPAAGLLLARRQPYGESRRFLTAGVGTVALAGLLFAGYVVRGIDVLLPYVGYFFWAAPLLLLMLLVTGAAGLLPRGRPGTVLPVVALAAALVFAGVSPAVPSTPEHLRAGPGVIRAVAAYGRGRPAVLSLDHDSWPEMTALLIDGERAGQRVCVRDRSWQFIVTSQMVCGAREIETGVPVTLATQPGGELVSVSFGGRVMSLPTGSD
ncbi:MAG TPA: hypothetical protein VJT31_07005 [Rugosimonospora sp.]|nr:hypothetical protein [Rugosimonospora sp.]